MSRNSKARRDAKKRREPAKKQASSKPVHTGLMAMLNQAYTSCDNNDVLSEREQYQKHLFSVLEQYPVPFFSETHVNRDDAVMWALMAHEVLAIEGRKQRGWVVTEWQNAQLKLMRGLLGFSFRDLLTDEESAEIREAGVILNEIGGKTEMIETLNVWIPRVLHHYVDYQWDGIGDWRC